MRFVFILLAFGSCLFMCIAHGRTLLIEGRPDTLSTSAAPMKGGMTEYVTIDGRPISRKQLWLDVAKFSCGLPLILFVILIIAWRIHTNATSPISKHGGRAAITSTLPDDDLYPH